MKDCKKYFEKKVQKIRDSGATEVNKEAVLRYIRFKQSQGLTYSRMDKIVLFLENFLKWANFEIRAIQQSEVEEYAIVLNDAPGKDWTRVGYVKVFKTFLFWLRDEYDLKIRPEKLKASAPKNSMMPEYLITPEEFNKLMNVTDDLQTRLILGVLYESGARIGELLSLQIKNVSFNDYGARLSLKGKTGQRMVPIVWFANLLRQFLEVHPFADDQEALLFYFKRKGKIKPLNYEMVRMRLSRLCGEAGIKKRIHPHLFRHTRMTELAKQGIGEQTLKAFAGWTGDSKMAATYVHLANKDVEDSLLTKVYGMKLAERGTKEEVRVCPKCSEVNPPYTKLCQRCKTPLEEKEMRAAMSANNKREEVDKVSLELVVLLKQVAKDRPGVWKDVLDAIRSNLELPA